MKKYCIITVLILSLVLNCIGQSLTYEQKYQFYRERFNKYFIFRGMQPGESLPFRRTSDNFLWTDDLPNLLGLYIGVLATEYKLTKNSGKDISGIVQELYYALYALNRLDTYAADIGNTARDGFLIREDVPADFLKTTPPNNHYSELNQGIPGENYPQIIEVKTHNGRTLDAYRYGPNAAALSMDHYTRVYLGLALVKKCVDENAAYAAFQDGETSIKKEAMNIADRIITYMKNGGWFLWMPKNYPHNIISLSGFVSNLKNCFHLMHVFNPIDEPCTNCPLITGGGILAPRGCAPIEYCFGFSQAGKAITGKNYGDVITKLNFPLWKEVAEKNYLGLKAGQKIYSETGNLSQVFILAAIGDSWKDRKNSTQYYMHLVDQRNQDWRLYTLLHCALHDKEPIFNANDDKLIQWLDRAPDIGPNNNDDYYYTYNIFTFPSNTQHDKTSNYTMPGLDYMLLYNLYRINFFK